MPSWSTRHNSRRPSLCAVAFGVSTLLALSEDAAAQAAAVQTSPTAAVQRYALDSAPLDQTLDAIAKISGRRVVFDESLVKGLQAAPVAGVMNVRQAVEQALKGTGLMVSEAAAGALQVDDGRLQSVTIVAKRDQAETSFKAARSDTATRGGTDLHDVPQSVTIITSKVLESQQALSVYDALANVSGVTFVRTPQDSPTFSVRGYSNATPTVNGLKDPSATLTNVFNVERIEVLKGPQAILAGGGGLGGAVNVVTKKPQAAPIRSLLVQYGTYGDATVAGDLAGALTSDKKLSYRLLASKAKAAHSDGGFDGRNEESFMPQLRWKDKTTDLIVGLSYGKSHDPTPDYTSAQRDGLIVPSPAHLQGKPEDGFDNTERRAFYSLEQMLTPEIMLVSRMARSLVKLDLHLWQSFGLNYTGATPNGSVAYAAGKTVRTDNTTSGDHYLRIEADTGPVAHKLSIGLNHTEMTFQQTDWNGPSIRFGAYPAGPAGYPARTVFAFPDWQADATTLWEIQNSNTKQIGAFAQDLMTWGDWNLLVNLRRTRYETRSDANFVQFNDISTTPAKTDWSTTPGVGLVYKLTPETSLYASVAEGFNPQTGSRCGGGLLPPVTTNNKEMGVKFDLLNGKLLLTTAVFELDQDNTITSRGIGNCNNVGPARITRGLEVDMQGRIAPGWNASFNYAYNTVKDEQDSRGRPRVIPGLVKNKMSLWTTYDLQDMAWKGFGLGVGLSASSKTPGNDGATFTIPGSARLDASVFYNRADWNVTFGVKNIADKRIYGTSASDTYVPVLPGRNYMLTVKHDFN